MRHAVGFLTVLPVRSGGLRRRSVALFPLVGLMVGAAWAALAWLGLGLGGPLVAAAGVLAVDLYLTGGLHLDGTADTADGLASHRPPEQAREVMKDPRVGALGAGTQTTVLIGRFALVAAIAALPSGWLAVAAVPVVGRLSLVWQLRLTAPRAGSLAAGPARAATAAATAVATVVALVAVTGLMAALGLRYWPGAAGVVVALGLSLILGRMWTRRLGASGDVLGAAAIAAEIAAMLVLLAAMKTL